MSAAKETPVSREWWWMWCSHNVMFLTIDEWNLGLGVGSSKEENEAFFLVRQYLYDCVGKILSAYLAMRGGVIFLDGKDGIEEKYPLFGSMAQISRCRYLTADVAYDFFVDIV